MSSTLLGKTFSIVAILMVIAGSPIFAGDRGKPLRKSAGIEKRIAWTTSRIVGTPDPPLPFTTQLAFPKIKFHEPLSMAVVPGVDRFVIATRPGKIYTFDNRTDAEDQDLLIDVGKPVYGVALHPQFAKNGYFYVTYIHRQEDKNGSRLSRFRAQGQPPQADTRSETVLLQWPSGGHNGGCIRFGPDGYLYLATGDASGIADELHTGQNLADLPGSILRIDVDRGQNGKPYAIPADNPFVNLPGARPEIYSYGHRQVWKFSFDRRENLFAGEVGQDLWEMIYVIQKGGNYGWSVTEGSHPFRPERKKGPTPILKPLVEHPHSDFRSITGGYVYYSSRLPQLRGHYIYGDYDTGRIWALRYVDGKAVDHRELADTQIRLVEFGQDRQGEVYLVCFARGQIFRLAPAPKRPAASHEFPRKLSATGLFASTKDHTPAAGVIPYSVNAPLWSDGGEKERFLALPEKTQIEFDAVTYPQPAPGASPGWRFPDGTVLVKTFLLETKAGDPHSRRRLETRILHHEKMPGNDDEYGAQVWRGYTYLWNEDQTDADLLDAKGLDREYAIEDAAAPGGIRTVNWRFPSRAECHLCHTMSAKYALGVNTLQINKDHIYHTADGPVIANQLATFNHLGLFTKPLDKKPDEFSKVVDYRESRHTLNQRARSYLHANCSHCHRKWGGGNAEFQLLAPLDLADTGTVNERPGQGRFKLRDPYLIAPGAADRSMILHRMKLLGLGRMPHIASRVIDQDAVKLIQQWIKEM